jgi:hypothetical protein
MNVIQRPDTTGTSAIKALSHYPRSNLKQSIHPSPFDFGYIRQGKLPFLNIMDDVYRLPIITKNIQAQQRTHSRPYRPPATANSTHMKFESYKHNSNAFQNLKVISYEKNSKGKLNTSESNDTCEDKKMTDVDMIKPGTAFPKGSANSQPHPRICSANIREKRPESRYKKETICNKLDLEGCTCTHEYYIPILRCGNDTRIEGIMPDCWKNA